MLNENKIRLMTKMAVFEKREGTKDERMDAFFKGDYISSQLLRSFLCATLSFAILLGVYCYYNFESLMLSVYSMDLLSFMGQIIVIYVIFTALVLAVTFIVYAKRYDRMRKGMQAYYRMLSGLSASYQRKEES
ncbi:MAG: hypothetical protein Q4C60_04945 [Eubacteriales bacterium]|nr:hypothetical protein [Eubacteriales bacterium]